MWLTLDAATFKKVSYNTKTETVILALDIKTACTSNACLRVDKEVNLPYEKIRGAYNKITLKNKTI
jgi:hypothetical protein